MGIRVKRIGPWLLALVLALAAVGALPSRSAGGPGLPATAEWAWIVVRDPDTDQAKPTGVGSGNSTDGINYVDYQATGVYVLTLSGVGAAQGNVLVSPLGPDPRICAPASWATTTGDELVEVRCFTRTGAPANATFVLNWLTASGTGGRLAYALDFSPTSNCGTPNHQYDSMGGTIATCPATYDTARYKIPSLGSARGTVQVTPNAHRAIDADLSAGICDLVGFYGQIQPDTYISDEWIDVKCFETNGTAQIYRENEAWFMQGLGMKGVDRTNVAYLLADKPGTSSYTPDADYSYSSEGGINEVTRLGTGRYVVTLHRMPKGGSAQVTAYMGVPTAAPRHCVIASIAKSSAPATIGVRCFDLAGTLADSKFTLAYAR